MPVVAFGEWRLDVDDDLTAAYYRSMPVGGAEQCGCAVCSRFVAVRQQVLPESVRDLLRELSVPYDRETEVYDLEGDGSVCAGWFLFAGDLVEGPDSHTLTGDQSYRIDLQPVSDSFRIGFTRHATFFGDRPPGSWVQLDFSANMPPNADAPTAS